MIRPATWQAVLLTAGLIFSIVLLVVWWRQQTHRWGVVLAMGLLFAPLISWWSGLVFQVADYRAGCDGLCPGFRGAPLRTFQGQPGGTTPLAASFQFMPGLFVLNSLIYLVIFLAWAAVIRAVVLRIGAEPRGHVAEAAPVHWRQLVVALVLVIGPLALAPLYLPPAEAYARGDSQRVAINSRREVFMYDQLAPMPILRVGLEDVRPRRDDQPGMRVCWRTYTLFYIPVGFMYMDMAPEGVHSSRGGVLPANASCWQ